MITVEHMELRLDRIAAEALRREARRLDLAGANKVEHAAAMATTRAKLRSWRDRASASALRDAVGGER